jgi:hypothetical protein
MGWGKQRSNLSADLLVCAILDALPAELKPPADGHGQKGL